MSAQEPELVKDVPCAFPQRSTIAGRFVRLVPMREDHADRLYASLGGSEANVLYNYMFYGPFMDIESFREHIAAQASSSDPQFYTIEDIETGDPAGQMSLLRIDLTHRVIEIGHIIYSRFLQRSVGATEAFYLLVKQVFDEGYRRLEWKCDSNNQPSRRAAVRYGHTFEGVFRQHMIVKGKNRDSAWFSILDKEWPSRKKAFEEWLEPANFDENYQQRKPLKMP